MALKILDRLERTYERTASLVDARYAEAALPIDESVRVSGSADELKAHQGYELLAPVLIRHDKTSEFMRFKDDYTHVSSLIDGCPRQYALILDNGMRPLREASTSDKFVWAMGRSVENHIRSSYIEATDALNVYGIWACSCGDKQVHGFRPSLADVCESCRKPASKYQEYTIFNDEYQLVGNPDFLIYLTGQGLRVVEIKSIKGNPDGQSGSYGFDTLTNPVSNHVVQALAYRRLLQLSGLLVDNFVTIIYANKDYKFRDTMANKYKEYIVDATTTLATNMVLPIFEQAAEIAAYRKDKIIPARVKCCDMSNPHAKKCPALVQCFSRNKDRHESDNANKA